MAGFFLRFSFRFYPCFLPFPFIFGKESNCRGGCFPHHAWMPPWAVASSWISWCKKTLNKNRIDVFWREASTKKVIHINVGTGEKIAKLPILLPIRLEESFMLLTHRIAQISLFWPQCCGHLVTPTHDFQEKGESSPNSLIYVLKNPSNLEKILSLVLQAETGCKVGLDMRLSKTFPGCFGTK